MKVAQRSQSHCLETWTHISSQLKCCSFPSFFFVPHCFSNWLQRMSGDWPFFYLFIYLFFWMIDSPTMMSHKRELSLASMKQQEIWLEESGKNDPTKTKSLPCGVVGQGFLLLLLLHPSIFLSLRNIKVTVQSSCFLSWGYLTSSPFRLELYDPLTIRLTFHLYGCPHPFRRWPTRPWCSFWVLTPPNNLITRCPQPTHMSPTLTWSTCGRAAAR